GSVYWAVVVADFDILAPRDGLAGSLLGHRRLPRAGQPVHARADQEVGLRLDGRAEQLEDVALPVADVDAPGRVAESGRGLFEVIQPANALLLLGRDAGGVDTPLEGVRPLELRAGPELDGRQAQRDAGRRDHQAGVHQQ